MGTLWYGGSVRPLTEEQAIAEAVFTEKGKIVSVGTEFTLREQHKSSIEKEIHLDGKAMYPGFTDSHLHMIGHGEKLLKLDVSSLISLKELKEVLQKKALEVTPGEWVLAEGFNENLYENYTVPDREFLDGISDIHPIMITRVCRHAMVTNSLGLSKAGITKDTPDPEGGRIERYQNGEPTGYLHDQAQDMLREVLPQIDRSYVKRALEVSLEDLYQYGFTGAHTEDLFYYNDPKETLEIFHEVISGEKKFRANLLVHHEAADTIFKMKTDSEFVTAGSVKIFTDGALGGRTALLSEPYSDDPSTKGVSIHSQEELSSIVAEARKHQMPVAIHTIGDAALELAVTALELHPVREGARDRLIHLQVTRPDLRKRMRNLSLVLDIQPRFVASDFPWVENRLGKERLRDSFIWKTMMEEGLLCAGGSDAPIEPINPFLGIHAAVTRRKPEESHQGYQAEQKLTLFEALRLFTAGSARAISREHELGEIAPGFLADFTILSEDLFALEPDEWLNVKVCNTVVDETIVYERKI